jgi:hypothetical protein
MEQQILRLLAAAVAGFVVKELLDELAPQAGDDLSSALASGLVNALLKA